MMKGDETLKNNLQRWYEELAHMHSKLLERQMSMLAEHVIVTMKPCHLLNY